MKLHLRITLLLLAVLVMVIALGFSVQPHAAIAGGNSHCVTHKDIDNWFSTGQLRAHGFNSVTAGSGAISFKRFHDSYLSLDLSPTTTSAPAVARITEGDASKPVSQRVKCWKPTASRSVVATFEARFDAPTSPSLTETLFLWNMPFGATGSIPLTAFGVARSAMTGGSYAAIVAQDLVINPDGTISGYMNVVPVPSWLNATKWHRVRISISRTTVTVEVAQGWHGFTPVVSATLPHAPEALAMEFSIDNELAPGFSVPVASPDGVDIDSLTIKLR